MTGQIVTLPEGLRAKCTDCLSPLYWSLEWEETEEDARYTAVCCGHRYTMYPETMRLEREQD